MFAHPPTGIEALRVSYLKAIAALSRLRRCAYVMNDRRLLDFVELSLIEVGHLRPLLSGAVPDYGTPSSARLAASRLDSRAAWFEGDPAAYGVLLDVRVELYRLAADARVLRYGESTPLSAHG